MLPSPGTQPLLARWQIRRRESLLVTWVIQKVRWRSQVLQISVVKPFRSTSTWVARCLSWSSLAKTPRSLHSCLQKKSCHSLALRVLCQVRNPVERFVRDLRGHQILEGTSQIMRMVIGRKLIS
ncbi:MAG: hypothetical protein E2O59_08220 [Gammaproteobacteria bacterium]|nr:MAG: hypothetical protein E2O59_08220 [Gammaproteobacteria bacterium]